MNKKIKNIFGFILILLSITLAVSLNWFLKQFGQLPIDQYLFHLSVPLDGANTDVIGNWSSECIVPIIIISIAVHVLLIRLSEEQPQVSFKIKKWKFKLDVFPFTLFRKNYFKTGVLSCIIVCIIAGKSLGVIDYVKTSIRTSSIFEDYYISANDVEVLFPEKKRNLILIHLESMEATYTSKENLGAFDYDLIPELTNLAKENVSFSHNTGLGGAYSVNGTAWTIAGMVAQTSGIPLKIPMESNSYNVYQTFLPNNIALGDILADEGYNQTLMIGSDMEFGGRKKYFTQHGDYNLIDKYTLKEKGYISEDYDVWWGCEDTKLFEFAKKEILEVASKNEPFNFSILTVDTHFPDGYLDENAEIIYDKQFKNVLTYSSKIIGEFIDWIKEQEFYENTVIVLVGDHLSMDNEFFSEQVAPNYQRTVYNAFINSSVTSENISNRIFTTMDIFPSILTSMGVTIEGERLGLGTNLFSKKETMAEELGIYIFDEELTKKSSFYNSTFLYGK